MGPESKNKPHSFIPEGYPRGQKIVFDNPRVLGAPPGPAFVLLVLVLEGLPKRCGLGGIGMERQIYRLDLNCTSFFIVGFEKYPPIFRNFVRIPVINLIQKLKRKRVVLLVYQPILSGKLREVPNRRKGIWHPCYCGKFPDVVVKHNRRLPETVIAFRVIQEFKGQERKMLGVIYMVCITRSNRHVVNIHATLIYEFSFYPNACVAFVGGLAYDLSRGKLMNGYEKVPECFSEFLV